MSKRADRCGMFVRHNSGAAALLLAAGLASPAIGANWHWSALSGAWSDGGNWLSGATPPNDAHVMLGSLAGVQNSTVWLAEFSSDDVADLTITDGMTLRTNHGVLDVTGDTLISGSNTVPGPFGTQQVFASRLLVEPIKGETFRTHDLTLSSGARMDFVGQAFARIEGVATIGAGTRVGGLGYLDMLGGGTTLVNDGVIRGNDDHGMRLRQLGGGLYDLDGLSGDGELDLSASGGVSLHINGSGLADTFSGVITLAMHSDLHMNLDDGWTADANSEIRVEGAVTPLQAAHITGGAATLGGLINVVGPLAAINIAPTSIDLLPSLNVVLEQGGHATFGTFTSQVTVHGGEYHMGSESVVRFFGDTTVLGGHFIAETVDFSNAVNFFDPSTWNGDVVIDGLAYFHNDVAVSGATTIDARALDMDGAGDNVWSVQSSLVIDSERIDYFGNTFAGVLDIGGGFSSRLELNLDDPNEAWTMAGSMDIEGNAAFALERLAGSRMILTGALTLDSGRARIGADLSIESGATVTIGSPTAMLTLTGDTTVRAGAAFEGDGLLLNSGATLLLHDGADLADVGLRNAGTLLIADGAGAAAADRLELTDNSLWIVDFLPDDAGSTHDLLIVTGGAALDGLIEVNVAWPLSASDLPAPGEEYTILTALGGVTGLFKNDPVSTHASGLTLEWSVIYYENSVALRLDAVVPTPGTGALAALGLLVASRRRRATLA